MSKRYDEVVVGAGIAGIVVGLLKARQGQKVALIDTAKKPGGLMSTYFTPDGKHFDYGTHLLSELAIEDLDDLLFNCVRNDDWHQYDYLKSGHYTRNTLCATSPVIDATTLDERNYLKAMFELVDATANPREGHATLAEQLCACFGDTIYQSLLKPAVEKLFFADANDLAPNSHLLYGLARVQGFSAEAVRVLKNLPELNDVLAFRSHLEGKTGQTRFYPKHGGIGQWVEMLIEKFQAFGGDLYLGVEINDLQQQAGNISAITLTDTHSGTSETLELSHLTWTVAPFHLLRLANLQSQLPAQSAADLTFLDSWLVHLVVDKAPITDLHYYCNYDPKFSHFRSTLYSNMQGVEKQGEHRVTIEIFTESSNDASVSAQEILQELIDCQVFPDGSQVIYENIDRLPRSFPVPTVAFRQQQQAQTQCLQDNLKNVELYGKARGDIFFMNDVILDVYHHVNQA